jgi:hypothetical protein
MQKYTVSEISSNLKLKLRALMHPSVTRCWTKLLNCNEIMRELAMIQPRILHKVYRPWFSCKMNHQERLEALTYHYEFIQQHGLDDLVIRAARHPVEIAVFSGKNGIQFCITLCAIVPLEREGELVLQLHSYGDLICSVAFSFINEGAHAKIAIGCVQGPKPGAGLDLVRTATRNLFGLRPKNLLMRVVRQVGNAYRCSDLVLVGNVNRAAARKSFRQGKVKADYDSFWIELGANRRSDGDFELACGPLIPPAMENVIPKKRSEVRRRHELLEVINFDILSYLFPLSLTSRLGPVANDLGLLTALSDRYF